MKELKVGDRVRVFTWDPEDEMSPLVFKAIVAKQYDTGMIAVTPVDGEAEALKYPDWIVHPKQCRRLVKKERRRVWIDFDGDGGKHVYSAWPGHGASIVEFVEVRPKK